MSNDILSSPKWNEMKKSHNNLRKTQFWASHTLAHILPLPFLFLSSRVSATDLFCGFTRHFTGSSMLYKVRSSGSFNHFWFSLKKKKAIFLPSKQLYNTISKTHEPFSLNKEGRCWIAVLLFWYLRIGNCPLKWWRRVFHIRNLSQGTSMAGFSASSRVPPKVSWNDLPISLSEDLGHFLYSWAVAPICFLLFILQFSLPQETAVNRAPQVRICSVAFESLLSLSMCN